GKVKLIKKMVNLISKVDDLIEKEMYFNFISERFNIDFSVLKREAEKLDAEKAKKKDKNYKSSYTKKDNETNTGLNINKLEALVLKIYLEYPEWRKRIIPYFNYIVFPQEYHDVIKILIENKELEFDNILEKNNDPVLKKKLLSLIVSDKSKLEDDKIIYILDKFNKKAKINFYRVLQKDKKMDIAKLNKLLICFKQLSVNPERRELNG
ncbi:MAG TPA: hypothetical protein VKY40_02585, partial [Halanaerobiales bacterium]|nr:hypothetical protein [Halanaerobiales bacterium]